MLISIIIPTWNNKVRLQSTLDAMRKMDVTQDIDYEIIVVNNNSCDDTPFVVKQYADILPLRHVFEPRQGLSIAKNRGIQESIGELLLFADDDVLVPSNWVNEYVKAYFRLGDMCFFGGSVHSLYETDPPHAELIPFAPPSVVGIDHGSYERELSTGECLLAANWGISRKRIIEFGSFDINLGLNSTGIGIGEETDLMDRLEANGMKKLYLPDITVKHFVPDDKTNYDHISNRFLMHACQDASSYSGRNILGFHVPFIAKAAFESIKWLVAICAGRKGYAELINLRRFLLLRRLCRSSNVL